MEEILIREMIADDCPAVIKIITDYNQEHGKIAEDEFEECFFKGNIMKQVFHVAVVSGKIAGVMGYKPDKEGADHVYWAVWLYIDRKYMRKGIASRLWKSIEQNMIEKGARKCYLDVGNESDQPEAIAFHKKQGFELEGVMKDYWKDGEDMMLFGKRLKPFGEGEQYMNQVKFVSLEQLAELVGKYKTQGKTVVHCHGCFDLYHVGHLRHMKKAKKSGDILIVTITPDQYVNKGENRPAFSEDLRAEMISALEIVDHVAINKWDSAVETLQLLRPNYYVKGPDYRDPDGKTNPNIFEEEKICQEIGCKLVFTDGFTSSSTKLLNQHFNLKQKV